MKVSVPLVDAVKLRPNLRGLLSTILAQAAHETGAPVKVVKGTKVVEVSKSRLAEERGIYEEMGLVDSAGAE